MAFTGLDAERIAEVGGTAVALGALALAATSTRHRAQLAGNTSGEAVPEPEPGATDEGGEGSPGGTSA